MTARQATICREEVLELLRGSALEAFEAEYAARLGYSVTTDWGDTQKVTHELATAGITKAELERVLLEDRAALTGLTDAILALPDDGEEYPPAEEPDEGDEPQVVERLPLIGKGFSLTHGCTLWLLRNRGDAELVSWVNVRRIPFHRKHARDLREVFERLVSEQPRTDG